METFYRCVEVFEEPPVCNNEVELRTNQYCGLTTDTSHNNPFRPCMLHDDSDTEGFMEACVYDACAIKESSCTSLDTFAEYCENLGIIVDWRRDDFCRE